EEGERILDPQKQLEVSEDRRHVREALARMAPKPAAALAMRASGLGYTEVAQAPGVGTGQVGTLLRRAEATLRKEVTRGTSNGGNTAPDGRRSRRPRGRGCGSSRELPRMRGPFQDFRGRCALDREPACGPGGSGRRRTGFRARHERPEIAARAGPLPNPGPLDASSHVGV